MKVPLSTSDFLERAKLVYGQRIGIVDEPDGVGDSLGSLTNQRIWELAQAQAAGLDELGVKFGSRVAIVSKNSARLLVSLYGVTRAGRVLVPINFRLGLDEITYIVEHSGAEMLLVDAELANTLKDIPCQHRIILEEQGDETVYRFGTTPEAWSADEDATATINYTSGTTARPKGVQLTHRNLWINAVLFGLHAGVSDRDVYLHTLPMFHCNGWGLPYILAGMGAKQVVIRQVDGAEILRRIEEHGVTLLCGAPTVAKMILDAAHDWSGPIPGRDRVRMVVAGAPPPRALIKDIESVLGWEFIQVYGLTETSPLATMNCHRKEFDALDSDQLAARLGRAGPPVLGIGADITEDGEVLLRGNVVLDGYWNDEAATNQAIRDGWFHTGDGGRLDEDNYLVISDRKKDIIITGGENVSSIEVEDTLFSHPAVAEVAVIGVPDEKWGETVKALVVLAKGVEVNDRELIDYCRENLAHFKCPTSIEFRDELPRTATGKLQKYKLRES